MNMTVDLTPIVVAVVGGVFNIVLIAGVALINSKIKDTQMRDVLESALKNGLGKIQVAAVSEIQHARIAIPDVPPEVAVGVQYVLDHAPEAAEHFGLSSEAIADKIIARIGVKNVETNIAIASSASPEVPEPLAPVPVTVNGGPVKAGLAQAPKVG
jgi:hypothetical protein